MLRKPPGVAITWLATCYWIPNGVVLLMTSSATPHQGVMTRTMAGQICSQLSVRSALSRFSEGWVMSSAVKTAPCANYPEVHRPMAVLRKPEERNTVVLMPWSLTGSWHIRDGAQDVVTGVGLSK